MARELLINIKADGAQAKRELGAVEDQIENVGKASQTTDKQVAKFGDSMKVVGSIAGIFATSKIGDQMQKLVDAASRIADTGQRLGITAEAVQRLSFAAGQGGSSIEAVASAMGNMAEVLGSKDADKKLAAIGLSLDQIKGLTPDQTFLTMADAIRKIHDPLEQSDRLTDMFGNRSRELLPAIKNGFREVGEQAPLMSNAIVASGDHAGDSMDKLRGRIDAVMAKGLIPLSDLFFQLPESVQTATAGIYAFLPSLEQLALGIIAAGGPTAALAGLKAAALATATFIGTTFATIAGGVITFLTVTLPAAFGAVIAFLGPQGLIALALLALLAIWVKWGDDIKRIVAGVYTAVKEWLVDKLNAVWSAVGAGVEKVTGFFADMYNKVVGNSYVPDMIERIGQEFGKLQSIMVDPTKAATQQVLGSFKNMEDGTQNSLMRFVSIIRSGVGTALGVIGTIQSAISLAVSAWHGLQRLFGGGEEGVDVNPNRDKFFAQYGGYEGLAEKLTAASDGNIAERLIRTLYAADTRELFNAAQRPIVDLIGGNMFKQGTFGKYVDFGPASLAVLHGKERVMTEAEGRREADSMRQVFREEFRDMRRGLVQAMTMAAKTGAILRPRNA